MRMLFKVSALLLTLGLGTNTLAKSNQKVLIVVTSHDKLGNTGKKTGFWLPELTHPYYELTKAGIKVDIASPQGGSAPIDMNSFAEKDSFNDRFLKDAKLMAKVIRTIPLAKIKPKDYAAVIYSGGSGAMWDFANNKDVNRISKELYEMGGVVSAICHGTAALSDIKLSNGKYLIDGKKFAAFTRRRGVD